MKNSLKITTTIHSDFVNSDLALDHYDFENTEFEFFFRAEYHEGIEIGGMQIETGGEEIELIMTLDELGNEVDLELSQRDIQDIYDENLDEGVLCTPPASPMKLEDFISLTTIPSSSKEISLEIEAMENAIFSIELAA